MNMGRRKYRKTAVVEAVEITAEYIASFFGAELPEWMKWAHTTTDDRKGSIGCYTKLGVQSGSVGDFLIFNPDGEVYPCPRDTFLSTYEAL